MNPNDGNVRLYSVREGKRRQLASWSGAVQAERWSALSTEATGEQLAEYWNGDKMIATPRRPLTPEGLDCGRRRIRSGHSITVTVDTPKERP